MSPADSPHSPLTAAQVADMLDQLAAVDRQLADELDRIGASRSPVSRATVAALESVLVALRPAAQVRELLARADRRVLLAGLRLWERRRFPLRSIPGER
jgi:hypothetical protein